MKQHILLTLFIIFVFIIYYMMDQYFHVYENMENITNMPIFIINLERSKNRWENMKKQAIELNLSNVIHHKGIDGSEHVWTDAEMSLFNEPNFNINIQKGVAGCALSHYYVWKKIVNEGIDDCIVCEDDIIYKNTFIQEVNSLRDKLENYEIVFFYVANGDNFPEESENNDIIKYETVQHFNCLGACYYINFKGAKHLCDEIERRGIDREIDWYMVYECKNINIGYTKRPLITLSNVPSDIDINGGH